MFKKLKGEKGFTLIETMIVVMIIASLALIGFPIVTGQQEIARKVADEANVRNLETATELWVLESGITVEEFMASGDYDERMLYENLTETINGYGPYLRRRLEDPWGRNREYFDVAVDGKWLPLGKP